MTWINVEGLGDARTDRAIRRAVWPAPPGPGRHGQRAPAGEGRSVWRHAVRRAAHGLLRREDNGDRCGTEQISLFIGPNWLLSFQEGHPGDSFDRVRMRLREGSGKMRTLGSDYLAYALIDAVIDNYYPVLEVYAERLDELEEMVMDPAAAA